MDHLLYAYFSIRREESKEITEHNRTKQLTSTIKESIQKAFEWVY